MEEQAKDFKETFAKAKELGSSHIFLEEVYFYTPNNTLKSQIICDSSYVN